MWYYISILFLQHETSQIHKETLKIIFSCLELHIEYEMWLSYTLCLITQQTIELGPWPSHIIPKHCLTNLNRLIYLFLFPTHLIDYIERC